VTAASEPGAGVDAALERAAERFGTPAFVYFADAHLNTNRLLAIQALRTQ